MATVTLQKLRPNGDGESRSFFGPVTNALYIIDQLGRVTVNTLDSPRMIAAGWEPIVPGSGGGSIGSSGTSTIDFGAIPGSPSASVTIAAISPANPNAVLECFVAPIATVDHSVDEHTIDPPLVSGYADGNGNVVIVAVASGRDPVVPAIVQYGNTANSQMPAAQGQIMPYGKWSVGYAFLS